MSSLVAQGLPQPQAYFYLGKFQPFHNGHLNVLTQMVRQAEKDNARVFLFSTKKHDSVTNPIPPEKKEEMLQKILKEKFPEIEINFIMVKGLFDATEELAKYNITHATIMAGDDRVVEYTKKGNKRYNGVYFTVSPIDRTKDKISGTVIRNKIIRGDPDVYNYVDKVYTPEDFTKLVTTINIGATTSTHETTKRDLNSHTQSSRPSKKSKKSRGGNKAKTYRRRRSRRRPRRRRTRRNVST